MKGNGWDARLVGVVALGLTLACESRAPIAALTFVSGVVVAGVMYETLPDGSTDGCAGPIRA